MRAPKQYKSKKPLIIIILTLILLATGGLSYYHYNSTKNDALRNIEEVPTVKGSSKDNKKNNSNVENSDGETENSNSSNKQPTKMEGKTPSQYEGEAVDDAPEYNNEQFRIPEED